MQKLIAAKTSVVLFALLATEMTFAGVINEPPTEVPEPGAFALFAGALVVMAIVRRNKRK